MNPDFSCLLTASVADRRGLFLATAARLGTTVQNVEKDFWLCWTLDALFNGLRSMDRGCCSRAARRYRRGMG